MGLLTEHIRKISLFHDFFVIHGVSNINVSLEWNVGYGWVEINDIGWAGSIGCGRGGGAKIRGDSLDKRRLPRPCHSNSNNRDGLFGSRRGTRCRAISMCHNAECNPLTCQNSPIVGACAFVPNCNHDAYGSWSPSTIIVMSDPNNSGGNTLGGGSGEPLPPEWAARSGGSGGGSRGGGAGRLGRIGDWGGTNTSRGGSSRGGFATLRDVASSAPPPPSRRPPEDDDEDEEDDEPRHGSAIRST
ncbi:hypothetical protein AG1IA_09908 [Rhizoctonia solani AG-1 IA]|uniref:Uncharacterized protein n=1 Tax=Thanatephorus cucumeris (strain AG1-IA) TaxID=983506 RepID=L8WH54_THACA|nr:hypothetical protein AG1IA_09908 [Rhizoctonia solani AG-1 IA]